MQSRPVRLRLVLVGIVLAVGAITAVVVRPWRPATAELTRDVMRRPARIIAVGGQQGATEVAFSQMELIDRLTSTDRPDSEISRLNGASAGQLVSVDRHTFRVLSAAERYGQLSGGAFDVTCRPLLLLWKQAAEKKTLPAQEQIDTARAKVGIDHLILDDDLGTVGFDRDQMQVELAGLAPGYAIDLAIEALQMAGCRGGRVDLAGDLRCFGVPPGGKLWQLDVRDSSGGEILTKLMCGDCAVGTAGSVQRNMEAEGGHFSGIIDPRSGKPVARATAAVVLAPTAIQADALATTLCILDTRQGMSLIERMVGVEAMVITDGPEGRQRQVSSGFDAYVAKGS